MAQNPLTPSFRYPLAIPDGIVPPEAMQVLQSHSNSITDINQAIASLKRQIDTAKGSTTTVQGGSTSITQIINGLNFPGLGGVNDQTGNTTYTVSASDNGRLLWLNDASAVAASLDSALTTPFFLFAENAGAGTATFTPTMSLLINYPGHIGAASMPLASDGFTMIWFDGATWWGITTGGGNSAFPLVIGFVVNSGTTGTNIGPMLAATRAGSFTKCIVVTKASDGTTALTFKIRQNGTDVFATDPTVSAGTGSGTVSTFTTLTSSPLPVAAADVFSIDITSGSANWQFSTQLE